MNFPTAPEPTQTSYPWRAVVRTVIQAAIGIAAMLPLLISVSGLSAQLPVVAGMLAISALVTRIMAMPGVNVLLARLGLGTSPASQLTQAR